MIKLKDILLELTNDEVRSWALHADIYEKIFQKIKNKKKLEKAKELLLKRIKQKNKQKAINYFYKYRMAEL